MRNIFLILSREVYTRVKTKQFWILSILGPLIMSAVVAVPVLLAVFDNATQTVLVKDDAHLWVEHLPSKENFNLVVTQASIKELIDSAANNEDLGVLIINSKIYGSDPSKGIRYISNSPLSMNADNYLTENISKTLEDKKLEKNGVTRAALDSLKTPDFTIPNEKPEGSSQSSAKASGLASAGSMLMYFFILIYGMQVLRGVSEEKSNRIMEVLISTVKPIELMLGKILGIACVALLQFLIWIGLTLITISVVLPLVLSDVTTAGGTMPIPGQGPGMAATNLMDGMGDMPWFIGIFFFYFIFGFLTYAALFAAIGSAVDQESDAQQLTFPVTVPIIVAFILAQTAVAHPHSPTAFWSSMIPLTAPVVMMARVAFDAVAPWELALSMTMMVLGFFGLSYLSARVYRVGVLMYGKKVTLKELSKWVFKK